MTQPTPEQGRWREPIIPELPRRHDEIMWARNRPASDRPAKPVVGQIVGLRLEPNGVVRRARIVAVRDERPLDTRPGREIDWNVWRYVTERPGGGVPRPVEISARGDRAVELVDDPWWDVTAETAHEGKGMPKLRVECREARLPGDPGWLSWGD